MSTVDLGIRVLLTDMASPSFASIASAVMTFGNLVDAMVPKLSAMAISEDMVTAKLAEQAGALSVETYALMANADAEKAVLAASEERMALLEAEYPLLSQEAEGLLVAQGARKEYDKLMVEEQQIQYTANQNLANYNTQLSANEEAMVNTFSAYEQHIGNLNADATAAQAAADAQEDFKKKLSMAGGVLAGGVVDLALFGAGLKSVVDNAKGLQDALAGVQIATNASDKDMEKFTSTLTDLAGQSIYSTTELASGFELLGEKGYKLSDMENGVLGPAMTNLSEAIGATGSEGVTGASNLLSSVMEIFKVKAKDAAGVADLLTYAFYHGIPSADGLRSAYDAVGARAALLGIPLSDLTVALTTLGRAGLQGSQAGTSLNYALTALSAPIPKAQKELADLKILVVNNNDAFRQFQSVLDATSKNPPKFDGTLGSLQAMFTAAQKVGDVSLDKTFYSWGIESGILTNKAYNQTTGNFDLINSFNMLADGILKLPKQDQLPVLQDIFNVKSGTGAALLLQNMLLARQRSDELTKSHNAQGLAAKDAADRTNTLNAKQKELATSLGSIAAGAGMQITNFLKDFVDHINTGINAFTKAHPGMQQFITNFLLIGAALAGLAIIGGVIALLVLLGGIIGTFLVTTGLVAVGIAVVAGVASLVIEKWKPLAALFNTVKNAVGGFLNTVKVDVLTALGNVGNDIHNKWDGVVTIFNHVKDAVSGFFNQVKTDVLKKIADIGKDIHDKWDGLVNTFNNVKNAIITLESATDGPLFILKGALNGIAIMITAVTIPALIRLGIQVGIMAAKAAIQFGIMAAQAAASFLSMAAQATVQGAIMVAKAVGSFIAMAAGAVVQFGIMAASAVANFASMVVTSTVQTGIMVAKWVAGVILMASTAVIQFVIMAASAVVNFAIMAASAIVAGIAMILPFLPFIILAAAIGAAIAGIILIVKHWGDIMNWFGSWVPGVIGAIGGVFSGMFSAIGDKINQIIQWFKDLPGKIMGGLSSLGTTLSQAGGNFMQMLANGITGGIGKVLGAAGDVATKVKGLLGFKSPTKEGPLSDSDTYMPNMMKMYAKGIVDHTPLVHGAMNNVALGLKPGGVYLGSHSQSGYGSSGGSSTHLHVHVGSKEVADCVIDHVSGQLKMNNMTTAWR